MKPDTYYGERLLAENVSVSNDIYETGLNNNDLIIGPTGAGKTGGYVIPNIIQLSGSIVVADTKCNLYKKYGPYLRASGYRTVLFDLVEPENSDTYNPLDYIAMDSEGQVREQDVMTVVNALAPALDSKEPFWDESAKTVLACLVSFVKEAFEPEEQNLRTVAEVYGVMNSQYNQSLNEKGAPYIAFLEEWALKRPESFASKKYFMFRGVMGADKTWACICQFVTEAIDIFNFKEAEKLFFGKSDFRLATLGREHCALFLNISDTDRTFDKIVNLFYAQVIHELCVEADRSPGSRLRVPVRVIMDDFATNTNVANFDKMISVIRSRDISVSLILQSLTQLYTIYKESAAMTIVNNCDHILYLGGNDAKTAEFISLYADIPVTKVLWMPRDKAYLVTRGERARLVDKIKPYSITAEVPQDEDPFSIDDFFDSDVPF
ncbi:MAG: type IV secretory system conjugative DNA transfer family protein [Ruminococcus sp.]|nr:type IV secretory system conjugative DNA transfer family protein [Ruminococcus sp.]MBR1862685.1 type IV secretory system conjugative DNA transfer family protein [Ruminococcus sp.]